MMKFVLILTLYNAPGEYPAAYVMADSMSGNECIAALESFAAMESDIEGARLTCEIDNAE